VLGLGWPASFGFVVGPSPIVWLVSVLELMLSPLVAPMWLSASESALISVLVLVLVLRLALGMGLGLILVLVLVLASALI
jgi:hypothetical protein